MSNLHYWDSINSWSADYPEIFWIYIGDFFKRITIVSPVSPLKCKKHLISGMESIDVPFKLFSLSLPLKRNIYNFKLLSCHLLQKSYKCSCLTFARFHDNTNLWLSLNLRFIKENLVLKTWKADHPVRFQEFSIIRGLNHWMLFEAEIRSELNSSGWMNFIC